MLVSDTLLVISLIALTIAFFWTWRLLQFRLVQKPLYLLQHFFFLTVLQKSQKGQKFSLTGWVLLLLCGRLSGTLPWNPSPPSQCSFQQRPRALLDPSCSHHSGPPSHICCLCTGSWCSIMLKILFMGKRNHILPASKGRNFLLGWLKF